MYTLKNFNQTWFNSSWDITTATQDQMVQPTSISNNRTLSISKDWLHILLSNEGQPITEHTLSTAWDLTSNITTQTATLKNYNYTDCVLYSDDGGYIYVCATTTDGQSTIEQRVLSTPFDISTAWSVYKTITVQPRIWCFRFYDNWTKIIGNSRAWSIVSATLSTAWDISTIWSITTQASISGHGWNWFAISSDWLHCYALYEIDYNINEYTTTTAYDFTTNTRTYKATTSSWGKPFWVDVSPDGRYLFMWLQNWKIYRYSFTEAS